MTETAPLPGPGVDAQGVPVIDPTANVLALVDSAVKRLDDLREQEARRFNDLLAAEKRRVDDLREQDQKHRAEMTRLTDASTKERQKFNEDLRVAETARIDAIRSVDVNAVARAAEVSAAQASTLAAAVTASAEALRSQVALTASAAQTNLAAALEPIQKDISDLRKTQYEQAGSKAQATESRGFNQWAVAFAVTLLFLIMGAVGFIINLAAHH